MSGVAWREKFVVAFRAGTLEPRWFSPGSTTSSTHLVNLEDWNGRPAWPRSDSPLVAGAHRGRPAVGAAPTADGGSAFIAPDRLIDSQLNRVGLRTGRDNPWTETRVRAFKTSRGIAVYREGERQGAE